MAFPNLRLQNIFDQFGGGYDDPYSYQDQGQGQQGGFYEDPPIQNQPQTQPYQGPSFDPSLFHQGMPSFGGNDGRSPTNDFQSWMDAMNKGYTPDTTSTDRLNQLLNSTPNIHDYNPSFGRKLTASLAGWKDPAMAEKILNAPYAHDMADWQAKTGPYAAAAAGENQRNIQERTLVSNAATSFAANQRNADIQRKNEEDIRIRDKKLEQDKGIADQKAQIARDKQILEREKMNNANVQFTTDTPTMMMYDKATKKWTDTGIPTKDMSTAEKIYWQGAVTAAVNAAKPQPPQSELDQSRGSQRLMEGLSTDPEAAQWIEVGDDGRYRLKKQPVPSAGGMLGIGAVPQSALDSWMKVAKRVYPEIYGTTPAAPPPPATATPGLPRGAGGVPQAEGQVPGQQSTIPRGTQQQQSRIQQEQVQPPSNQTQSQTQTRRLSPEQQQQQTTGLANGTLIRIQDARSGQYGIIPNTYQDIQEAMQKGWNVVKGK